MRLLVAAAAISVAIPYSISLTAQWFYGWPDKPGYKKYIEALKPRYVYYNENLSWSSFHDFDIWCVTEVNINLNILLRRIYRLTRAVLEMMKYLQYSKLYFQWKLWYRKNNSKQFVKVSHLFFFWYDFPSKNSSRKYVWWKVFLFFCFLLFDHSEIWIRSESVSCTSTVL